MHSVPTLALNGPIATLTLNRPAQRNRIENADLACLLGHFDALNANLEVRVVVLTANTSGQPKPVFSSGYDMGALAPHAEGGVANAPDSARPTGPERFAQVADAWAQLRPITLCALNGSVYGGATDWVTGADVCVAQAGVEFKIPATAIGFHYYPSGLQRCVDRLGTALAKRALLTAQALPIEALAAMGALHGLVPSAEMQAAVHSLAEQMARLAPLAAQATKCSINELAAAVGPLHTPLHTQLHARLHKRMLASMRTQDFAEGTAAFAARRPPQFVGL